MRTKQKIPSMMPQKKWLSKTEAMAYVDLSINEFQKFITTHSLTMSCITGGKKIYFKVDELDKVFEKSLVKKGALAG